MIQTDSSAAINPPCWRTITFANRRITPEGIMSKIAVFYHCLFYLGDPPMLLMNACETVRAQMALLRETGLIHAAAEIVVGINGGKESNEIANILIPRKAKRVLHGLQCRNECRTILALERWLPGHSDWYVLYFHAKGSTNQRPGFELWRDCMTHHCIKNWRQCVADLDCGHDAAGCHWMVPPAVPIGQRIFAGTFFWAKASYLLELPSIMERDRIKVSGLDSLDSRYEAEVWIGNGPRAPKVKDYHGPNWNPSKIQTCKIQ